MPLFARTSKHDLPMPERSTELAAGVDLRANLGYTEYLEPKTVTLFPGDEAEMPTGWAVDLGKDTVGLLCPRSGLGARDGLVVGNLVGIIDGDYRGELVASLWYRRSEGQPITITHGDRIAQLALVRRSEFAMLEVPLEELGTTARGTGGFGSSGVK